MKLFGESLVVFEDEPLLIVNLGSAVASTRVAPWYQGQTLITTRSYVVTNVAITAELSYYLLRENNSIYFGRFAYDAEDDIVFEHSLVGTACDSSPSTILSPPLSALPIPTMMRL
jgi:hypothetical protein